MRKVKLINENIETYEVPKEIADDDVVNYIIEQGLEPIFVKSGNFEVISVENKEEEGI